MTLGELSGRSASSVRGARDREEGAHSGESSARAFPAVSRASALQAGESGWKSKGGFPKLPSAALSAGVQVVAGSG